MAKRGIGDNCFDNDELIKYYDDYEDCVWCIIERRKTTGADCFDHVISRKNKYTNSILNASPVHNQTCNIGEHGRMHTRENQEKMIYINAQRLHKQGYKLNENDLNFIKEHNLEEVILKII